MVQIRSKLTVFLGLLLTILLALFIDMSLIKFIMILISINLILDGIFYHKAALLSILFGFVILASVFIWLITQNAYFYSVEVVDCIASGIISLLLSILVHSSRISEKWIHEALG